MLVFIIPATGLYEFIDVVFTILCLFNLYPKEFFVCLINREIEGVKTIDHSAQLKQLLKLI